MGRILLLVDLEVMRSCSSFIFFQRRLRPFDIYPFRAGFYLRFSSSLLFVVVVVTLAKISNQLVKLLKSCLEIKLKFIANEIELFVRSDGLLIHHYIYESLIFQW